jgi:hypothetical protein
MACLRIMRRSIRLRLAALVLVVLRSYKLLCPHGASCIQRTESQPERSARSTLSRRSAQIGRRTRS